MIVSNGYRSWIEIDLRQIRKNYEILHSIINNGNDIMAVIKADAYGHGAVSIARVLEKCGVSYFAVANLDEAIVLRNEGIRGEILILSYTSTEFTKILCDLNLTQTIVSEAHAKEVYKTGHRIKVHFAIDTGMNRVGLNANNSSLCENVIRYFSDKLDIKGIFTHLCVSDSSKQEDIIFTSQQVKKFTTIIDRIRDLNIPYIHYANSAAAISVKNINDRFISIDNLSRLGIVLYGQKPNPMFELPDGIRPAMTWKSTISMLKYVYPGDTIGYGRTFKVSKLMRVATITTGYADGYSRLLSNKGVVLINGEKANVVGRVCMDQTMIDVTNIRNVKEGDSVVLLGRSGVLEYNAEDMANDIDTISYEVITNISKRVRRYYYDDNEL